MPSPGSERRRDGFLVVLRRTGALDLGRSLATGCSDVRDTGRFVRDGREPDRVAPDRVFVGVPSDGVLEDARRGDAAAARVGVSQ